MQACFSWEADMFRCSLCMQIFAADGVEHDSATPVIVCKHIHTICRCCSERMLMAAGSVDAPCPQCRTAMWKQETVNRDLVELMGKLQLKCGSCDNEQLMTNSTAIQHAKECSGSHVQCPMFLHDTALSMCMRNIKVCDMWDHVQEFHNASNIIVSAPVATGEQMGMVNFSFDIALHESLALHATAITAHATYNLCLHVLRRRARDHTESVAICIRRFFPAVLIKPHPSIITIQIGRLGGVLLHLPEMISCQDKIENLFDAPIDQKFRQLVQLPLTTLWQMDDAPRCTTEHQSVNMTVSMQLQLHENIVEHIDCI